MRSIYGIFLFVVTVLTFTSCNDNTLARQLEGTWKGGVTISYDDQSKERQDIYLKFHYVESDYEDGGTVTETRYCHVKDVDLDDMTMDADYRTFIQGKYEILNGDLYIKYDVSTLKVELGVDDINLHYNNTLAALRTLAGMLGDYTPYDIANDLQKEIYKDLFHQYQDDTDDDGEAAFLNLKVGANNMNFDTDDAGTVHLTKTKDSTNSVTTE